jgi:ATPase family AAA domain-containing protein 3A/B
MEGQEEIVKNHEKALVFVKEEQDLNKKKREDIMEQVLRAMATTEVLSRALQGTELRFSDLETSFALLKEGQKQNLDAVKDRIGELETGIAMMKDILKKEAHTDLVEKRKRAEADLEKTKVLKEIEALRYEEEQKTIKLRNAEKKEAEAEIMRLHKDKIKYEQERKKEAELALLHEKEASELRTHAEKAKHELHMKKLELEQQQRNAELDLEKAVEQAKVEQEAKIRELRENEDVHARQKKMELEGQKRQIIAGIQATAKIVTVWMQSLYGSSENLFAAVATIVGLIASVYFTREMAVLLREQLNKRLGRPSLVRMTSRKTRLGEVWLAIKNFVLRRQDGFEFSDVVLHPTLEEQIMRLANATKNAKSRKMPLLHIMFYGPPGTGKTMCAQRFAAYSGLEFAFMSGGDVAPLEEQAVTELHKLFSWVNKSRKGVLLFIDEADAFLSVRSKNMSEQLRNAITTMLYHTGTPTSQFCMVLATNRPQDLDPAVLDRIDESVEFGLPDFAERERMVNQYFNMYVTKPLKIPLHDSATQPSVLVAKGGAEAAGGSPGGARSASKTWFGKSGSGRNTPLKAGQKLDPLSEDCDEKTLTKVSEQLRGFSGREIAKLFTGLQTHICAHMKGAAIATRNLRLTKRELFDVVKVKVEEHGRTLDVLLKGYEYVHKEEAPQTPGSNNLSTTGKEVSGIWNQIERQLKAGINPRIGGLNESPLSQSGTHNQSPLLSAFSREEIKRTLSNTSPSQNATAPANATSSLYVSQDMTNALNSDLKENAAGGAGGASHKEGAHQESKALSVQSSDSSENAAKELESSVQIEATKSSTGGIHRAEVPGGGGKPSASPNSEKQKKMTTGRRSIGGKTITNSAKKGTGKSDFEVTTSGTAVSPENVSPAYPNTSVWQGSSPTESDLWKDGFTPVETSKAGSTGTSSQVIQNAKTAAGVVAKGNGVVKPPSAPSYTSGPGLQHFHIASPDEESLTTDILASYEMPTRLPQQPPSTATTPGTMHNSYPKSETQPTPRLSGTTLSPTNRTGHDCADQHRSVEEAKKSPTNNSFPDPESFVL